MIKISMKKVKFPQLILFILGIILLALGIVLFVKGELGMSVIMSLPYVLNLKFTQITLGTWSYIVQGAVFILCVIVIGRMTVKYLLSFGTAILFGLTIDLFNYLLSSVACNPMV